LNINFFTIELNVLNINLLSFRIFELLALAWKTELLWKFLLYGIYFLDLEFLSNLRLPWKTELPSNFSLHWNIFLSSRTFWATTACPENRVCPEIFQTRGSADPPHRLVRLYSYHFTLCSSAAAKTSNLQKLLVWCCRHLQFQQAAFFNIGSPDDNFLQELPRLPPLRVSLTFNIGSCQLLTLPCSRESVVGKTIQ